MARYVLNDVEVYVEQWHEQGHETLVLFHGFTSSTKTWHPVVEQLPQHIRVIAVDLMGHGKSAAPQDVRFYSMGAQIELLEALFLEPVPICSSAAWASFLLPDTTVLPESCGAWGTRSIPCILW